jgi:hypothetical protein
VPTPSREYLYADSLMQLASLVRQRFGAGATYPNPAFDTIKKQYLIAVDRIIQAAAPT